MKVTLGASVPGDIPALRALWQQAFGDAAVWPDLFFAEAYTPAGVFVLREDGVPAAMAAWFPGTLCDQKRGWPGAYLYAVATEKQKRGRGYCRRLLDFISGALLAPGIDCLCLCPAEPSLFDFYKKLGFSPFFTADTLEWNALPETRGEAVPAEAPAYLMAREAFLQDKTYFSTPVPVLEYQKKAALLGGGDLFLLEKDGQWGCALAVTEGETAHIQELLWPGVPAEAAALVCKRLGATRAVVRTPGTGHPFAMLKWLRPPPHLTGGYLGIALE